MSKLHVKIKKLVESATIPKYALDGDAGMDLHAVTHKRTNGKHEYGTGIAIEIPVGYVGLIFPRSSISKTALRISNSVGVIDSNYRGEIMFKFDYAFPLSELKPYSIGDRIGQLIIVPYPQVEFEEVSELSDSSRGSGGFGSTGM